MLKRIGVLIRLQLSNRMNLRIEDHKRFFAGIALRLLVIAILSIVMTLVLHVIADMLYIPVNHYFMIFVLIITQGLGIVSATSKLMTDLYLSRENAILLSLPAKNDEVFMSKLAVFYIGEFIKNLYLLIPVLIAFGYINEIMILYYINIIPMLFLLPLLTVSVAALLSMPLIFVKSYLKNHPSIAFLLVVLSILFAFVLVRGVISDIPTPIRIVQLYHSFIISLTLFMQQSANYGLIFTNIGKLLYGMDPFFNYVVLLVTVFSLLALILLGARPLYFKLASTAHETATERVHRKDNKAGKNIFMTFLRKELLIARRSTNELLENYAILLTLPFFMYVLNYIYMGMNRSTFGNQLVLVFNVFIALLIVTAANTASASAISTEGGEFVLFKTAPSDTTKMAWAKIAFNLTFSIVIIALSFVLFMWALPVFPKVHIALLFVFVVLINSGHIFWSFQIDLLDPQLSDYAATGSLSGNNNIGQSIRNGFVLSFLFGGLSALLFVFVNALAWTILLGLAAVFLVVRLHLFQSFLKAYFMDIEF
jgi:ABC-2 type transport system permease protein